MRIEDGIQGGVWPLQDFNRKYEIPIRRIRRACRTNGQDAEGAPIVVERTAGDVTGWLLWRNENRTPTGLKNIPKKKPREVPTWAQVFPVSVIEPPVLRGDGSRIVKVLPIGGSDLDTDTRFEVMEAYSSGAVAKGDQGVVVAATEDFAQVPIFIPAGGPLKAVHRGDPYSSSSVVFDLTPTGGLDPDRWAYLNSLTRVYRVDHGNPVSSLATRNQLFGADGGRGLAIQLGLAKGAYPGRGFFSDFPADAEDERVYEKPNQPSGQLFTFVGKPGVPISKAGPGDLIFMAAGSATGRTYTFAELPKDAVFASDSIAMFPFLKKNPTTQEKEKPKTQEKPQNFKTVSKGPHALGAGSHRAGGPFHVGYGRRDKHYEMENKDGESIGPLHLSARMAKWVYSREKDAPLYFRDEYWQEPSEQGGSWFEAKLRYDPALSHNRYDTSEGDPSSAVRGMWRWQVQIPLYVPPPPDLPPPPGPKPKKPPLPVFPDFPDQPEKPKQPPEPPEPPSQPVPPDGPGKTKPPKPRPPTPGQPGTDRPPTDGYVQPLIFEGNAINRFNGYWKRNKIGGTARTNGRNVVTPGFINEISLPGYVVKPQSFNPNVPDLRHGSWTPEDAAWINRTTPAIGHFEGFGPQIGTGWDRTTQPGTSRYPGGTAVGAWWWLPPEVGGEQVQDGTVPATTSPSTFGISKWTTLGFGTPLTNGLVGDGFELYVDGGEIKVDTTDADGVPTSTGTLWPSAAGDIQSALDSISTVTGETIYYNGTDWVGVALPSPSGLTVGDLASRPATPSAVGETYVADDKMNSNASPSGDEDPTDFFAIGLNDALMWAKLAVINGFPQTVSSNWIFSGSPRVSGDLTKTGAGSIDANKLVTLAVTAAPSSGKALSYNGASWVTTTLGVTGGGTGLAALANVHGIPYVSAANTLNETAAPTDAIGGMVFQTGVAAAPGWDRNIQGGEKSGADQTGTDRYLAGMRSTGSGSGGRIVFKTTPAAASGSSVNSFVDAAFIDGESNVVLHGTGAGLATTATNGFTYLPFCAGVPTGVPASLAGGYAGAVPIVVDTTNGRLYARYGGAWNNLSGSGGGGEDLAATLAIGNTTGANDIIIVTGQSIRGAAGSSSAGGEVAIRGGQGDGTDKASGGAIVDAGSPTGTGGSTITFSVAPGYNTTGNVLSSSTGVVQINGKEQTRVSSSGNFFYIFPSYDDGAVASSGTTRVFMLQPSFNYGGATTGKYEAFVVDPQDLAPPGGSNLIAAFRVSGSNKITIASPSGDLTTTAKLLGSSTTFQLDASDGSLLCKRSVSAKTADASIAVTESRRLYTNEGAAGLVILSLPSAAAGLEVEFYVQAAQELRVLAASGDTVRIQNLVSATAGYASSSTVGSSLSLRAINATEWVAMSALGTWSVV